MVVTCRVGGLLAVILVGSAARAQAPAASGSPALAPLPPPPAPAPGSTPAPGSAPVAEFAPGSAPAAAPAPGTAPVSAPGAAPVPPPAPTSAGGAETATPPAPAGPPYRHEGFYARFSTGLLGYTSAFGNGPTGSASISSTSVGTGGHLAIGGTPAPGVVIAADLGAKSATGHFQGGPFENATIASRTMPVVNGMPTSASTQATATFFELGLLIDWFPNPAKGLHFGGSVGVGGVAVTNAADGSAMGAFGGAGSLFFGYDFWIGRSWSIGVGLDFRVATPNEQMNDSSGSDTGYRLTPISIAIEVSLLYF